MGLWRTTTPNASTGSAPTRWVGDSGSASSGWASSSRVSSRNRESYSASEISGSVVPVVAVVVVPDLSPQLFGAGCGRTAGHPWFLSKTFLGKDFDRLPITIIQWKTLGTPLSAAGEQAGEGNDGIVPGKDLGWRPERSR